MPGDSDSEMENLPLNRQEMSTDMPLKKRAKYSKFLAKGKESVMAENERRTRIRNERDQAVQNRQKK